MVKFSKKYGMAEQLRMQKGLARQYQNSYYLHAYDKYRATGTKTVTGLWYTGIKGKADGAFASLTFENGALTSKTQTDLK